MAETEKKKQNIRREIERAIVRKMKAEGITAYKLAQMCGLTAQDPSLLTLSKNVPTNIKLEKLELIMNALGIEYEVSIK